VTIAYCLALTVVTDTCDAKASVSHSLQLCVLSKQSTYVKHVIDNLAVLMYFRSVCLLSKYELVIKPVCFLYVSN
jgi:hypothetical protein